MTGATIRSERAGRVRAVAGLLWSGLAGVALVLEFATGCRGLPASPGWSVGFGALVWVTLGVWISGAWRTKSVTGDPEFARLGWTVGALASGFLIVHTALVWWPSALHGQAVARASIAHFAPTFLGVGTYVVGLVALALQLELSGRSVGLSFGAGEGARRMLSAVSMAISLLFFALAIHQLGVLAIGRPLFGAAS